MFALPFAEQPATIRAPLPYVSAAHHSPNPPARSTAQTSSSLTPQAATTPTAAISPTPLQHPSANPALHSTDQAAWPATPLRALSNARVGLNSPQTDRVALIIDAISVIACNAQETKHANSAIQDTSSPNQAPFAFCLTAVSNNAHSAQISAVPSATTATPSLTAPASLAAIRVYTALLANLQVYAVPARVDFFSMHGATYAPLSAVWLLMMDCVPAARIRNTVPPARRDIRQLLEVLSASKHTLALTATAVSAQTPLTVLSVRSVTTYRTVPA
jgi:hypothetical protein